MPPATRARAFTRREGLLALALAGPIAALAGCTSSAEPDGGSEATSSPGTATETSSLAAADESALVARYEAALAAVPEAQADLRALLSEIRDQHRAHLDALGGAADAAPPTFSAASPAATLADLIDAERIAAKERISACVDARDSETARILSLIAASEASHVPALRDARASIPASGGAA